MTRGVGLTHPALAVAAQWLLFAATGSLWIGAAAASGFFVGREIAQAEYRWIEAFGAGRRANMPAWGALDPRVWGPHSITDLVLPIAVTVASALYFS